MYWPLYFFRYVLLLASIIPISLRVNLDFCKAYFSYKISNDEDIPGTVSRNSSIPEELGRIEYLLSDKTGTLTCNIMEFKKMSIGGISYGEVKKGQMNYYEDISAFPKVTNVDFRDKQLFDALNDEQNPEHDNVRKSMFLLALCHTIITEK